MSEQNKASTNRSNMELTDQLLKKLRLITALLILITAISTVAVAWTLYGARLTALERTDEIFVERIESVEAEQVEVRGILGIVQQSIAAMDAKLDILVADRQGQ